MNLKRRTDDARFHYYEGMIAEQTACLAALRKEVKLVRSRLKLARFLRSQADRARRSSRRDGGTGT